MPNTYLNDNRVREVPDPQRGHPIHVSWRTPESHPQSTCSDSEIIHLLVFHVANKRMRGISKTWGSLIVSYQQPWKLSWCCGWFCSFLNGIDSPRVWSQLWWAWQTFRFFQNWYDYEGHASSSDRAEGHEELTHLGLELRAKTGCKPQNESGREFTPQCQIRHCRYSEVCWLPPASDCRSVRAVAVDTCSPKVN